MEDGFAIPLMLKTSSDMRHVVEHCVEQIRNVSMILFPEDAD
jgi:hypothetical protein